MMLPKLHLRYAVHNFISIFVFKQITNSRIEHTLYANQWYRQKFQKGAGMSQEMGVESAAPSRMRQNVYFFCKKKPIIKPF